MDSVLRSRSRPTGRSSRITPRAPPMRPHHPRKEWIAKYKGKFDQGWDKEPAEETLRTSESNRV